MKIIVLLFSVAFCNAWIGLAFGQCPTGTKLTRIEGNLTANPQHPPQDLNTHFYWLQVRDNDVHPHFGETPALTSPGGFGAIAGDRVSGQIIARSDNTFEVNQQFHHNGQVTSSQSVFALDKDSKNIGFAVAYDPTENRPIGSNAKVYCNNELFQPTWATKPPRPQWLGYKAALCPTGTKVTFMEGTWKLADSQPHPAMKDRSLLWFGTGNTRVSGPAGWLIHGWDTFESYSAEVVGSSVVLKVTTKPGWWTPSKTSVISSSSSHFEAATEFFVFYDKMESPNSPKFDVKVYCNGVVVTNPQWNETLAAELPHLVDM